MIDRSNEIVKELNRLVNDRNLQPQVRNKISRAVQYIKDLHEAAERASDLHPNLDQDQ